MAQRNASKSGRESQQSAGKVRPQPRGGAAVSAIASPAASRKAKTPAGKSVAGDVPGLGDAPQRFEAENKSLRRERDALKAELAATQEKLRALTEQQKQISDRVAWAIDSLQALLEDGKA